jgi:acyl carrier protein
LNVDSRVREVVAGVLEVPQSSIGDGFSRDEAPSWDSLAHLRLVSALEEAFGVRFTMQEVGELTSFAAIRQRLSGAAAGNHALSA